MGPKIGAYIPFVLFCRKLVPIFVENIFQMKTPNLHYFILLIALSSLLYGCTKGKGDIVIQHFYAEPFSSVELHIQGELNIVTDTDQYIYVQSHQNIIDLLNIETKSGKLIIKTKPGKKIGKYDELSFSVHTPFLNSVSTHGSGNIYGGNLNASSDFIAKSTASGNITLSGLVCQNIEAKTTASGNIQLNGVTENADFETSASGNIRSFGLIANFTNAKTTASGYIETTTLNTLNAKISGSGFIFYKGQPTLTIEDSGSGSVINSN